MCAATLVFGLLLLQFTAGGQQAPAPPSNLAAMPGNAPASPSLTETDAAQFEARLANDPNDDRARESLLRYYIQQNDVASILNQIQWLAENRPDNINLEWVIPAFPNNNGVNNEAHQQLGMLLERQASTHQDSAPAQYHAGLFWLAASDSRKAISYFERAHSLQPAVFRYLGTLTSYYTHAFASPTDGDGLLSPELAAELRNNLFNSQDSALLASVGTKLAKLATSQQDESLKATGVQLAQRAVSLDPSSLKWQSAVEAAESGADWQPVTTPAAPVGAVRIGAKVAEANLLVKADPIYPPLARSIHLQGVVEFTATIGADGHVQNVELVRGHPLLVQGARDAVLQYVYKPTLLNGNPVPVVTNVVVPYQLGQ